LKTVTPESNIEALDIDHFILIFQLGETAWG
jgi:hypothetical protein